MPVGATYPLGHLPTVMFHQPWLEAMVRAAAIEAGVDLRLGVEVTTVDQDDRGVAVTTSAA